MAKRGSPRDAEPSAGLDASAGQNSPSPSSRAEEAPLASTGLHEALAARAYALFLARGGQHGDDWSDWFHAEAELRQEIEQGRSPDGE